MQRTGITNIERNNEASRAIATVMARPIRIQYCGAVYHVMARGHHGQAVFADNRDRQLFLETLGGACAKTSWPREILPEADLRSESARHLTG